jgi:hypothetical protein
VSTYPGNFDRTLFVPGIGADLPLCYASYASIVLVFVPNYFLCVIDIAQNPPHISFLPKQFAASVCGRCCATAPIPNHIIDLDTADTYSVSFNFASFTLLKQIMTPAAWDVMANVCASVKQPVLFRDFFHLLEQTDFLTMVTSIHSLFEFFGRKLPPVNPRRRVSAQPAPPRPEGRPSRSIRRYPRIEESLVEFDVEFPSASGISRRVLFKELVDELLSQRAARSIDHAIECAHSEFRRQNQAVLVLREAVDAWTKDFGSDRLMQMFFGILLQSETLFSHFPAVPCLKIETEPLVQEQCSIPICHRLAEARVIDHVCISPQDIAEMESWRTRLPLWKVARRGSEEGSTFSQSSRISRTRSTEFRLGSDPSEASALAAWVDESDI